ncbi:phosphoribosyltransferase domain-containing protein [Cellulomonas cellasea]|uniref:Adenine/guanine phosphoribosyltransferase-like PRPP-binding protein n=1 Tax=Cellulomonas cellasea TaxID=43670 RepID=A0A7W4UIE9_9CELL|nr:phosphoribosyltransferase domain-containing protein [Cellulomonas cellasea]MBB2924748.1 adenine/guanine phosphoribosyltransferase-like PRPP-binding protein [Cellulomonas cellasea]
MAGAPEGAQPGDRPSSDGTRSGASTGRWTGGWVAERLGVGLTTTGSPVGVTLPELVGLALRRNPRRAHLLVSTVLGKHVPTDPRVVHASAELLGALAATRIAGSGDDDATTPAWTAAVDALAPAVAGVPGAAATLRARTDALVTDLRARHASALTGTVVLGYAETATALGHGVAEALGARYLHSTRRAVPGVALAGGFEEQHSHATSHLLLPEDPAFLAGPGPLVLVDDELSTGQTILNTITALHERYPRGRYVVAALVDVRSDDDRARFADLADRLGVRIDAVALVAGTITLGDDVLAAGRRLVEEHSASDAVPAASGTGAAGGDVVRLGALGWPADVPDGARHGLTPEQLDRVGTAARDAASTLADQLGGAAPAPADAAHGGGSPAGATPDGTPAAGGTSDGSTAAPAPAAAARRVLVLGTEELMHAPLLLAAHLADLLDAHGGTVAFSSTTRSPVLALDAEDYAIRTRLVFPSHDDPADGRADGQAADARTDAPADGAGDRFAYNVAPGDDPRRRFTDIVVVVDSAGDTPALHAPGGLAAHVAAHTDRVHLVVLPSYRPAAGAPHPQETSP